MRKEDPKTVEQNYAERRLFQSIYGAVVSFIGFSMPLWLPGPEWLIHVTMWLVILYGGMHIDVKTVTKWKELFGDNIPFMRGRDDQA